MSSIDDFMLISIQYIVVNFREITLDYSERPAMCS